MSFKNSALVSVESAASLKLRAATDNKVVASMLDYDGEHHLDATTGACCEPQCKFQGADAFSVCPFTVAFTRQKHVSQRIYSAEQVLKGGARKTFALQQLLSRNCA